MSVFFLNILVGVMGYLTEYVDYCMQGRPGHLSGAHEVALECGEERVTTLGVG